MGLQTKVCAAVLAALCAASALAQTTVSVPAQSVTVPVPAQTITVPARTLSVTVPATTITVPASSVSYIVPAYTLTLPGTQACGALPAPLKQTASCPAGSIGTYTQTATYSAAAYPTCAVLGAYSPAAPPAGACAPVVVTPPPPVASNCGQQLGASPVVFCDTFDSAKPLAGTRTGDLDPNVWGVSRANTSGTNFGQLEYAMWNKTKLVNCDGTTSTVIAPRDVIICNGQLREASNDNNDGGFEDGTVTSLAMYPKQPFDFAGRTGTVSFDVSNDAGPHGAWPEFWLSDAPVPVPFNHDDSWEALPAQGLGIRFDSVAPIGMQGECPNGNNLNKLRFTVESVAVVRSYVLDDTLGFGPGQMKLQLLDCAILASGPGQMNHIELRISQGQVDVYSTDAGVAATAATLKHIAVITNANLTLTRGLIWLEDVHYNGDKILDTTRPSQAQHTFAWDNVAFDGPFTYRDFAYDAADNNAPAPNGALSLGKFSQANQTSSWSIPNIPANPNPVSVKVLFNGNGAGQKASVLNVIVNGHAHAVPWPFPANITDAITYALIVPVTDLVAGTNVVQLGADQPEVFYNVDLVLVDVPGGVPVLPGSNNAYPH